MLQPSDHFCGPPLDPLQQVHVFPVLGAPELGRRTPDEVSPEQSRGAESTPSTCWSCFWAVRANCWLMSSFLSTSTPKSFLASLLLIPSAPHLYWYWGCRTLHLALLNCNVHFSQSKRWLAHLYERFLKYRLHMLCPIPNTYVHLAQKNLQKIVVQNLLVRAEFMNFLQHLLSWPICNKGLSYHLHSTMT